MKSHNCASFGDSLALLLIAGGYSWLLAYTKRMQEPELAPRSLWGALKISISTSFRPLLFTTASAIMLLHSRNEHFAWTALLALVPIVPHLDVSLESSVYLFPFVGFVLFHRFRRSWRSAVCRRALAFDFM